MEIRPGPQLVGSNNAETEAREVEGFAEISVGGAIKLDVTIGPAISISVTADDNILPHVKTEVSGDRLKIYVDESYSSKLGVKVQLAAGPAWTARSVACQDERNGCEW